MSSFPLIDTDAADEETRTLLTQTERQLGRLPNLYRAMANSPKTLAGYLGFRGELVKGVLTAHMRERIALLAAAINDCVYCVSAHTLRGSKIGLADADLKATQIAKSDDPKTAAALVFVESLMLKRGHVSADEVESVRQAGWSNLEIGEMVGHVALNVLSNYFNHVANPALDFPEQQVLRAAE